MKTILLGTAAATLIAASASAAHLAPPAVASNEAGSVQQVGENQGAARDIRVGIRGLSGNSCQPIARVIFADRLARCL